MRLVNIILFSALGLLFLLALGHGINIENKTHNEYRLKMELTKQLGEVCKVNTEQCDKVLEVLK